MSDSILKGSPYYDRYDPSKGYIQLLALPGRVAQAREFTEIQTSLRHIIKSVGDSVMKNGDIIEGCQIIPEGKTIKVTPGKVYMDGMVLPIQLNYTEGEGDNKLEYATVTIKGGVGVKEVIGVKIRDVVITENDDTGLRDPAQGHENYNQPGCNRLRRTLEVVVDDPEAAPIATLINGELMVETYAPEYDTLTQTLARRTYDESGSYIVDGLKVTKEDLSTADTESDYYNIVVRSGKAYILGYELKIPTDRRIQVRRSKDTTSRVSTNTIRYYTGHTHHTIESNLYVQSITQVSGSVLKTGIEMTRITNTNEDLIQLEQSEMTDQNTINGVSKVYQGSKTYVEGTDYRIEGTGSRISIVWLEEGTRPSPGSYTVDCTVNHIFNSTDYELVYEVEENGELIKGSYLKWTGSQYPANNTLVNVNYEIYLARKDIVYIDRYGNIEVLEGKPGIYGYEAYPEVPLNTLVLANISNPPNGTANSTEISEAVNISSIGLKRFTMNDIQNLLNRVQTMEHDQAVLTLNDDARQSYTVNDKKGIFTDPLIDASRIDFFYNLAEDNTARDPEKPIYDMALDLVSNICYLPVISSKHSLSFDTTDIESSEYRYNRLLSLRKVRENTILSQSHATTTFQVNPYTTFPQVPEVTIDPAVDSWFEDTIIEIPVSLNDTEVITLSNRVLDLRLPGTANNSNWSTRSRTYTKDTAIGTKTDTLISESVVNETAVTYIRPRTITVEGTDFMPGLSNIQCYFDGVLVPLSSSKNTIVNGAVTADDEGKFTATFTIPEHRLTGTREVLLKSTEPAAGFITEASALYVAQGIARRIERTVTTVTTVLLERVSNSVLTSIYVDPVGQSFVLDNMTLLKGINVYFASKPSGGSNSPIVCEIREVLNGTITHTVYARASLRPNEVQTDAEKGLKATRFNFSDPVLLEENKEYAFTLRSNSTAYRIWVSELGQIDRSTDDLVVRNSYIKGVMFSSSNNSTWTSHQTTDIKFDLIEDIYAPKSEINFEGIGVSNAARLYLSAESAIPPNTSVEWSYKLSGENSYKSITPYNIALLDKTFTGTVSLKATLSNSNPKINLSPLVAIDTLMLEESHYSGTGCYISQPINDLDPYTEVKLVLDTYTPKSGQSTFDAWISTDDGKISKVPLTLVTDINSRDKVVPLGNDWYQRTYTATLGEAATKCKLFIQLKNTVQYSTPAFRKIRCIMSGVN